MELLRDAVHSVSQVDGVLHQAEAAVLDQMSREAGLELDPGEPQDQTTIEQRIRAAFKDAPAAARAFVLELAGVVVIDGEREPRELELLRGCAQAAGVPADDVEVFLAFGERSRDLAAEGLQLVAATNQEG